LSHGVLVRAHVVARLLGVRLLRVDADVVLTPAELAGPTERQRRRVPSEGRTGTVSTVGATLPTVPAAVRTPGPRLDEVVRVLDEARASLEAARSADR
jgi:hypothetical protein